MFNETESARMFIAALKCQTNKDWECIIYHNGPYKDLPQIEDLLDHRFRFLQSETNTGYWGAYNRQSALELVNTSHLIQTSIHDYWMPCAVEQISKHLQHDFVYWNSINHLFGYHMYLTCEPTPGLIDWGNYAIKTEIAKKVGIKYPKEFRADGLFVKDCLASGLVKTPIKLNRILTIHN